MAGALNFSSEPHLSALDPDTLFTATIAAFTCLIQPKTSDLKRIDALLVPLYHQVEDYTKREAATKLSGVQVLPSRISSLLCSEPLEISVPILMAIAPLEESAMLHAIAKHGNGHLKLIAQRDNLPSSVKSLCLNSVPALTTEETPSLETENVEPLVELAEIVTEDTEVPIIAEAAAPVVEPELDAPTKAQKIRDDLLALMAREEEMIQEVLSLDDDALLINTMAEPVDMRQLVRYASDGETGLLATKISDHLDIDYSRIRRMLMRPTYSEFLVCLRALYCDSVTAFAVCAPYYADKFFAGGAAITLFYERADSITPLEAQRMVADWRMPSVKLNAANHETPKDHDIWTHGAADYLSSAS